MISDASSGGGGAKPPKKKKSAISSLAGAMADAAMAPIKGIAGATGRAGRMVNGLPKASSRPLNTVTSNLPSVTNPNRRDLGPYMTYPQQYGRYSDGGTYVKNPDNYGQADPSKIWLRENRRKR